MSKGENMKCIVNAGLAVATALFTFATQAELICYNGFSTSPNSDAKYCSGFSFASGITHIPQPGSVSSYMLYPGSVTRYPLSLPASFDDVSTILPVLGDSKDGAALFSNSGSGNAGAKVMTIADNCQSRTGQLHFRFLIRADQAALDGMTAYSVNDLHPAYFSSCGIIWSADDYAYATTTNTNLRLTGGFTISSEHSNLSGSGVPLAFSRGFMVGLYKNANSQHVLKLFSWGKTATSITGGLAFLDLLKDFECDKTYICHVRIDIDHYRNGDDRVMAFVQPVDDYDPDAGWFGHPFVRTLKADIVDGSTDLYANLVFSGKNGAGRVLVDEVGLATAASDLSLCNFADAPVPDLLAYDGFPCGTDGYSSNQSQISSAVNYSTTNMFGFSDKWGLSISKGTPCFRGEGTGLSLPACYSAAELLSTPGTAISYSTSSAQGMYARRPFSNGLLALSRGDVLYMRFLLEATDSALANLQRGPDTDGTMMTGTVGAQANVNYFGAGIADCSTKIETGESMAPTLCRRDNSCLVTLTKGSDAKVGLYLNLLTADGDTPIAHKIADVPFAANGSSKYTFLCFVRIEVGTGAGGKERISGFAANIADITDKWGRNWFPENAEQPIEHEIIGDAAYPKYAVVGGNVDPKFAFDEFALSLNSYDKLVWARRQTGFLLIFN